MTLRAILDRLEAHLIRLNRPVVDRFRPGIHASRTADLLAPLGLMSDELAAIYEWHDGTILAGAATLGDLAVVPSFYFLSLKDALDVRRDGSSRSQFAPHQLPILADGGGDYYLVDAGGKGVVRRHRAEENEQPVEYATIGSMVSTWVAAYDEQVIYVDLDGYLEVDDDRYDQIAREHNPGVAWWVDQ